jgi:hypothetical protein
MTVVKLASTAPLRPERFPRRLLTGGALSA